VCFACFAGYFCDFSLSVPKVSRREERVGECARLWGLFAEGTLEALPRFKGKAARLGFHQDAGILMGCFTEETELLAVAAAPFAEKQVEAQSETFGPGEFLVEGQGLQRAGLLASRHERAKPAWQSPQPL